MMTDLQETAEVLLEPLGYEILELHTSGRGKKRNILLRVDRLDAQPVSMDNIAEVTRIFSLELDRLDPFEDEYKLEVESPGAKRPFLRPAHYRRFHDLKAKVRVGDSTFEGIIREVIDNGAEDANAVVVFEVQGELERYAIHEIDSARLAEWPDSPR